MRFLKRVHGDKEELPTIQVNPTDLIVMDPKFTELKKQTKGLLHFLAMKYEVSPKELTEILLENLFD